MKSNKQGDEAITDAYMGHQVTISKSDYSQVTGKVLRVNEQEIILNLGIEIKGIEKNIWITIEDENGKEHTGFFVEKS